MHCQGFCCTFPVYVVQMGILGTCHRAGGGRERLLRNLEAPRASVLGGLGAVGLGFPRSARSWGGGLDSTEKRGIPGILPTGRIQRSTKEEALCLPGSPPFYVFSPCSGPRALARAGDDFLLPYSITQYSELVGLIIQSRNHLGHFLVCCSY